MSKSTKIIFINIVLILTLVLASIGVFIFFNNSGDDDNDDNDESTYEIVQPEVYDQPLRLTMADVSLSILPLGARAASIEKVEGKENAVRYNDAYTNTDIVQTRETARLKEDIILKQPGHPTAFSYQLNLGDFYYRADNEGNLNIYPKGHENKRGPLYALFTILAPFMIDADGNKSSVNDVEMTIDGDILIIIPSQAWLDSHQYPIVLDPSVEINVLNIQSYPVIGGEWEVDFTTMGQADLKIEALTHDEYTTVYDEDIKFISLVCGEDIRIPTRVGNSYVYENWSCDELAMFRVKVLKGGDHHLQFQFSDQTADAFNATLSPIEPVTRVDIAPGTAGSWQTVDLSSYIPADAEGICFEVVAEPAGEVYWGIQMGGSSDDRYGGNEDQAHHWGCIGVNASREVEIIVEDLGTRIDLVGYIPDGYGEFLTSAVDHSTGTTGEWVDVDVSADFSGGTCAVAFLEVDAHETVTASPSIGFRVNGRTNTAEYFDLYAGIPEETTNYGMMGLDGSEIFEQQIEGTTMDLFVVGCLYAGDGVHVETTTNPTEYSETTTGSFLDKTITIAQADNATAVFFTSYSFVNEQQCAIRKNGNTHDYYGDSDMKWGGWGWVAVDTSQVLEQRVESTDCKLWVWGWTYQVSAASNPSVTSVFDTPDPVAVGSDITFTVNWSDADIGENAKVKICKTTNFTDQNCDDGFWASSTSFTVANPENVSYTASADDITATSSVNVQISQSSDDAEECMAAGALTLTSTDLDLVNDDNPQCGGADQEVGMRWQNVYIPRGAQIVSAYVEFQEDEADTESTNLTFWAEAKDNAATFTTNTNDITNRATTTAEVAWSSVPNWAAGTAKHQTPDLSTIIQEVVDRPGWVSGNALAIIVDGTGSRVAEAQEGTYAPRLYVEYYINNYFVFICDDGGLCSTSSATRTFTVTATSSSRIWLRSGTFKINYNDINFLFFGLAIPWFVLRRRKS